MKILQQIVEFDSIEQLTKWLARHDATFIRQYLLREFDKRCYYKTAQEWNEIVKICEALAILGWETRKRVDAISSRVSNQWRTELITPKGVKLYRYGRWLKRKAGFYIFNCDDHIKSSCGNQTQEIYTETKEEDILCCSVETLLSQKNYVVQNQFRFIHEGIMFGGLADVSFLVPDLMDQLESILQEQFDPLPYAPALEKFYITVRIGWVKNIWKIKVGPYNSSRKTFDVYLRFDRDFVDLSEIEQRNVIVSAIREAVDALIEKLKKRKIEFLSTQFKADVETTLMKFLKLDGIKLHSEVVNPLKEVLQAFASGVEHHHKQKS